MIMILQHLCYLFSCQLVHAKGKWRIHTSNAHMRERGTRATNGIMRFAFVDGSRMKLFAHGMSSLVPRQACPTVLARVVSLVLPVLAYEYWISPPVIARNFPRRHKLRGIFL
jgi:hypothetical protein